jgi:hypothetical protein
VYFQGINEKNNQNAGSRLNENFTILFDTLMGSVSGSSHFYAPISKDRGHIVFGLSVCLSAKTLTLAISFEWQVIGISCSCITYDKTFLLVPKFFTLSP